MNNYKKGGFTLIESLVVVTMMMVIIAAAVSSYSAANKKNRDNKRLADLDRIRMALEMYRQNDPTGEYPTDPSVLATDYLDAWPVLDPKGIPYEYESPVDGSNFRYILSTDLEVTGVGYSVTNP